MSRKNWIHVAATVLLISSGACDTSFQDPPTCKECDVPFKPCSNVVVEDVPGFALNFGCFAEEIPIEDPSPDFVFEKLYVDQHNELVYVSVAHPDAGGASSSGDTNYRYDGTYRTHSDDLVLLLMIRLDNGYAFTALGELDNGDLVTVAVFRESGAPTDYRDIFAEINLAGTNGESITDVDTSDARPIVTIAHYNNSHEYLVFDDDSIWRLDKPNESYNERVRLNTGDLLWAVDGTAFDCDVFFVGPDEWTSTPANYVGQAIVTLVQSVTPMGNSTQTIELVDGTIWFVPGIPRFTPQVGEKVGYFEDEGVTYMSRLATHEAAAVERQ